MIMLDDSGLKYIERYFKWCNNYSNTCNRNNCLFHIKNNSTNNNQYNLYDNLKVREVGVSSSGFDTAINEPVVPQVPLMRYNQKMFFDWRLNTLETGESWCWNSKCNISMVNTK